MKRIHEKTQLCLLGIPKARYREHDARERQRNEVHGKHVPVKQEINTPPKNRDSTL